MKLIQQAAEDWNKSDERDYTYTGSILHFLQFLSQQGDDLMMVDMFRPLYQDLSDMTRRGHRLSAKKVSWQEAAELLSRARELSKQALAIGRASNRWIPVSERLPEVGQMVVVYNSEEETRYIDYLFKGPDGKHYWDWNEDKVTHWQPLPEPPIKNPS